MTLLRQKMLEDLQLRGYGENTQKSYIRVVRQLAEYYNKSPDQISDDELRTYFLHLINVEQKSTSTLTVALSGIKFFYEQTLQQSWPTLKLVRPRKEKKLPVVLSIEEVERVLKCVKRPHNQACLQIIYACGLRISEGVSLQAKDVDNKRMMIHIHQGKGGKDRYVPLPDRSLQLLRWYWLLHRNPVWLFPAHKPYNTPLSEQINPQCTTSVAEEFRRAVKRSGIGKKATVHTLRHSWATHLMEAGVPQRAIQVWLGHRSLNSTAIYTHLTNNTTQAGTDAINQVMEQLTWPK